MALLGDFLLELDSFPKLQEKLERLEPLVVHATEKVKMELIHRLLLECIQEAKTPCFLLGAVAEFIGEIHRRQLLKEYCFSKFEFWLNHFSGLSREENYQVRGKIAGRYIPRDAYQSLFPIGMGKVYAGSHYVTAHGSPDLDTTVASFWGWVDAFAARVGSGQHLWNVPGGPPEGQVEVELFFHGVFGKHFFSSFAKTRSTLALHAVDLLCQKGVERKKLSSSLLGVEDFLLIEDEEGYFMGEWRPRDGDYARKVTMPLLGIIRSFSTEFQRKVSSLLKEETVKKQQFDKMIEDLLSSRIEESAMVKDLTDKQKERIGKMMTRILDMKLGWTSSYRELWKSLGLLEEFERSCRAFAKIFGSSGALIEERRTLFREVEALEIALEKQVQEIKHKLSFFELGMKIKKEVFDKGSESVSSKAEVEEIRSKMETFSHVAVATTDLQGNKFALGVVSSTDLFKPILGTVSLRDFCNRDETKIPSYLEVISVIDHHKTTLQTSSATTVHISDAQSANVLVASLSFAINDRYSLGGSETIDAQIQKMSLQDVTSYRVLERLLKKKQVEQSRGKYFVDEKREYLEYLHYLYAILDDTDLLSKVSQRDIECVISLLNRMKTLSMKKESEVLFFEESKDSLQDMTRKVLQNPEMHSLYKKVYDAKERSMEEALHLAVKGGVTSLFADTKVQNGCCRVGQSKLFASNFPLFHKYAKEILQVWVHAAHSFYKERPECALHMQMISTVVGAEDVYLGSSEHHRHLDELWIWIPIEDQAMGLLRTFLDAFHLSPQIAQNKISVECVGKEAKVLARIFDESFNLPFEKTVEEKGTWTVAILRYKAGLLNSRKAMISPYLPKLG